MKSWYALILILLAAPAFGAPGDSIKGVEQLVLGPVSYLVAALGVLFCLYQFARGNKQAAFFALAGFVVLAIVRSQVPRWFGASALSTYAAVNLDDFPVYGQSINVQTPGETNTYQDIRAWGYIGLFLCNQITSLLFNLWVPILIALVGGLVTYWRIAVRHEPGSVVHYFLSLVLVASFVIIPWFTYLPKNQAAVQANDVIVGINALSTTGSGIFTTNSSMQIPALPALVLTGGVDVTEAIGAAINNTPVSANAAALLRAARAAQLPESWLPQYQAFASQCAAAQMGFLQAELGSKDSGTAALTYVARVTAIQHHVNGASQNVLSSWGDNLFAWIPLHGHTMNESTTYAAFTHVPSSQEAQASAALSKFAWVPTSLDPQDQTTLPLFPGRIGLGMVKPENFVQAPAIAIPPGDRPYTFPLGISALGLTVPMSPPYLQGDTVAIPYCSVPDPSDSRTTFTAPRIILTVDRSLHIPSDISGWTTGFAFPNQSTSTPNVTDLSLYLRDIALTLANNSTQGTVQVDEIDWGDQIRLSLIKSYLQTPTGNLFCQVACSDSGHKDFWGCLITGQFIGLGSTNASQCQSAADLTRAFYSPVNSGPNPGSTYAQQIFGNFYNSLPAKQRHISDVNVLQASVLANDGQWLTNPQAVRAAVDLILGAPGTYSQNHLAVDPLNPPQEDSSKGISLWDILTWVPKSGLWLLSMFGVIASAVINKIWPHFMGITLMLFLLIYPLFGMIALWPGRWMIMLDWARGMFWVLLWAPIVSLGYAFMNGGAALTQNSGFFQVLPGPGQSIMTLIGVAMVLMAPPIAAAVMHPTYATLSQLGSSVYGTGFKVVGMATTLAVSMLATGGAVLGGGIGAVKGARNAAQGRGPVDDGSGGGSGQSPSSGSNPPRGGGGSQIIDGAVRGARPALAMGRSLNRMASKATGAVDTLGLAGGGLQSGAHAGEAIGEIGQEVAGAAAMTGWVGSRIVSNQVATRAQKNGTDGQGGRRIAEDLAGGTGGTFKGQGFGLGDLIESSQSGGRFSGAGDAQAMAKFAESHLAAGRETYANATASGNLPAARDAASSVASYALTAAKAYTAQGNYQHAAESMKIAADAHSVLATGGSEGDFEQFQMSTKRALGVARDSEARAIRMGNKGEAQAERRMIADLKGQEAVVSARRAQELDASAHDNERVAGLPSTTEKDARQMNSIARDQRREASRLAGQAQTAAAEAMAGYEDAVPSLVSGLMTSVPAAQDHSPSGIRAAGGYANGLAMVSHQAQGLSAQLTAAGIPAPAIPASLQWQSIDQAISTAQPLAGSVAQLQLEAIKMAGGGNYQAAADSLLASARRARVISEDYPKSTMARYAEDLTSSADRIARMGDLISPIELQGAFMRQIGGEQGIVNGIDGIRHFDVPSNTADPKAVTFNP